MITIQFEGRAPSPYAARIGMENDHNAEELRFLLPELDREQSACLCAVLPDGRADVLSLEDGVCVIPRALTAQPGQIRAWVEISVGTEMIWHSEMMYFSVGDLPPAGELIEQQYPSALEEAMAQTAADAREARQARAGLEAARDAALAAREDAEAFRQQAAQSQESAAGSAQSAQASRAAAENAQVLAQAASSSASAAQTAAQAAREAAEAARTQAVETAASLPSNYAALSQRVAGMEEAMHQSYALRFSKAGNPVTCCPVNGSPLQLRVRIQPQREGTGDPTPENPRPLRGVSALSLLHTGKNLLNAAGNSIYYAWIATTYAASEAFRYASDSRSFVIPCQPNTTYYFANLGEKAGLFRVAWSTMKTLPPAGPGKTTKASWGGSWRDAYGIVNANTDSQNAGQITTGDNATYLLFQVSMSRINDVIANCVVSTEPIRIFEPYTGEGCELEIPAAVGTVYDGDWDVTEGTLRVNAACIPSYDGEALPGEWLSSMDVYAQDASPTPGAQVVYSLETPQVYALTPRPMQAFPGVNILQASAGSVTVEGAEDLNFALEELRSLIVESAAGQSAQDTQE